MPRQRTSDRHPLAASGWRNTRRPSNNWRRPSPVFKYWPGMTEDVRQYIRACERCTLGKHAAVHPPMGHLSVNRPPQILAIDFTKLDTASDGRENILIMTDVFTKYTVAVPTRRWRSCRSLSETGSAATKSQNASTVTRAETLNRAW